jgi:hypothetical protein
LKINENDKKRFNDKVDSTATDGCHPWTASTTANGYGQFSLNGKVERAHRVAFEMSVGPIPEGLVMRHLCSTRDCVNPDHLKPGTHTENMRDRDEAGNTPRGESSGVSKLKDVQVLDIRDRAAKGESQTSIAKYYKVSQPTIGSIINRKTWKHIP